MSAPPAGARIPHLLDAAVAGAEAAFVDWGTCSIGRRMEVLFAFPGGGR